MNILIVGSGGREHAIAWSVAKSPKADKIYCAPGNAGISQYAECVNIGAMEFEKLADFAQEHSIDLTIIGMDDPLVGGVVDVFEERGLKVFGPRKNAAILEGSKAFSKDLMKKYQIPGIYGIDTRKLVRSIRDLGSRKVLITDADTSLQEGLCKLGSYEVPKDAVAFVSRKEIQKYRIPDGKYHVAAIDCGMKQNIVRSFNKLGCNVTIFPWDTSIEEIEKMKPDGIFLSNGPGDPMDVQPVIELVRDLLGKYPIFGICLGHQIISLAYGARTYKLKFGHRGGNHPVKNLLTGKIEITSQNHSYAVDWDSLANTRLKVTHLNILDQTVEGVACEEDKVFSVQYHPESAPGPQDSGYLFEQFIKMMEGTKDGEKN